MTDGVPFGTKVGRQAYTGMVHLVVAKKNHWAASLGVQATSYVAWCSGKRGIHSCSTDEPLQVSEITCKRCAAHVAKCQRDLAKREASRAKEAAIEAKLLGEEPI